MNSYTIKPLGTVVFFALLLQVGLISLEYAGSKTPSKAVVSYARAYYKLDPAMADLLCDPQAADDYLYNAVRDAGERGFSKKFTRHALSHIETDTEYLDRTHAVVHLTAHRRISVNPVYAYIAGIFRMGNTHEVEESFQVRLEDGTWKVSDSSLPLSMSLT
jgi:hypothetical protein